MHTLLDLLFQAPVLYFAIVVVLIGSIVLHELGHALAATWERDPTPRMLGHITWNPVVHMGWLSIGLICVMGIGWGRTPVNPRYFRHRRWGSVLVSFAGPAVNVALACFAAFALSIAQHSSNSSQLVEVFWELALQYNTLLFLFNMVPLPPLDGFTVADNLIDLGGLGEMLRRGGMITLVVAILIVNSEPFGRLVALLTRELASLFGATVGPV